MNHSTEKCGPGNYSLNGFEPCTLCPQGEYQEDYEQKMCIKCPPGTTTGYIGTIDKDHCVDKGMIIIAIKIVLIALFLTGQINCDADPFPMDTNPVNVPSVPLKVRISLFYPTF